MNYRSTKFYQRLFELALLVLLILFSFDTTRIVIRILQWRLAVVGVTIVVLHKLGEKKTSYYTKSKFVFGWMAFVAMLSVQIAINKGISEFKFYPMLYIFLVLGSTIWVREELLDSYLKWMKIGVLIGSLSIVMEISFPDMMYKIFWFLFEFSKGAASYVESAVAAEIYMGAYSGFFGEKSDAAFLLNTGIALMIAGMIAKKKIKMLDIVITLIMYVALLLTGKRMLFILSIMVPLSLLLISDIQLKKKVVVCLVGVVATLAIGIVLISLIPELGTVFERFQSGSGGEDAAMTERYYFWGICIQMFKTYPLFGYGFARFADFARHFPRVGVSFAHNIYVELLGEMGLVGISFFIFAVGSIIWLTYRLYSYRKKMKENERCWYYYAIALQIIFLFYGITGNDMYYWFEITAYFVAVMILNNLYYRYIAQEFLKGVCYPWQNKQTE